MGNFQKNKKCYNEGMTTKRTSTTKTKITLDRKNANTIMRKEFFDAFGNKHILNYTFEPTSPKVPTIQIKTTTNEDK